MGMGLRLSVDSYILDENVLVKSGEFKGELHDPDYILGGISLIIDGVVVLDNNDVDYVDQLWVYLLNGIEDVVDGDVEFYYPDQPILLAFEAFDGVRFDVFRDGRRILSKVDYKCFKRELERASADFFSDINKG